MKHVMENPAYNIKFLFSLLYANDINNKIIAGKIYRSFILKVKTNTQIFISAAAKKYFDLDLVFIKNQIANKVIDAIKIISVTVNTIEVPDCFILNQFNFAYIKLLNALIVA